MSHSRNEIQMLGQKAARGGGAFPAQAAHFGQALVFHLAASRPEGDITDALKDLPGGGIQTAPVILPKSELGLSYRESGLPPEDRPALPLRLSASADLLGLLSELAQNTYVPNSDASRTAGAGAGLSDND